MENTSTTARTATLRTFRAVVRDNNTFETRVVEGVARNEVQFETTLMLDNETAVATVEL